MARFAPFTGVQKQKKNPWQVSLPKQYKIFVLPLRYDMRAITCTFFVPALMATYRRRRDCTHIDLCTHIDSTLARVGVPLQSKVLVFPTHLTLS